MENHYYNNCTGAHESDLRTHGYARLSLPFGPAAAGRGLPWTAVRWDVLRQHCVIAMGGKVIFMPPVCSV
jgi:hypothetical protein